VLTFIECTKLTALFYRNKKADELQMGAAATSAAPMHEF